MSRAEAHTTPRPKSPAPALASAGVHNPERLNPWSFPGIAEYAGTLERQGLEVTYAALFDRPTRLDGGGKELANWLAMFGGTFSAGLDPEQRREFERAAARLAEPRLLRDGVWTVGYRRLRVFALRPPSP